MIDIPKLDEFKRLLNIEKERQLAMIELSNSLGIDISFSNEEIIKNAEEKYTQAVNKKIAEDINKWMKSIS